MSNVIHYSDGMGLINAALFIAFSPSPEMRYDTPL
jgi:hypothetical protein